MAKLNLNNPLLVKEKEAETKKHPGGRPANKELVRKKGSQQGLPKDYTRASFIMKVADNNWIKDYAYTHRVTVKEAMETIVDKFRTDYEQDPNSKKLHKHR